MEDLIRREAAQKVICGWCGICENPTLYDLMRCDDICPQFASIPSADVCPYYIPNKHDRGDDSLCQKAKCEVGAMRPVNEWISVEVEEKPMPYDAVDLAILGADGYGNPVYYTTIGTYKNGGWIAFTGQILSTQKVTHWKPRQEPPEVE